MGIIDSSKLGKKLLLKILLVSSLVTTLLTAVSFIFDYRAEESALSAEFEQLRLSVLPNFAVGVYDVNHDRVSLQAKGLLNIQSIQSIKVMDDNEEAFYTVSKDGARDALNQEFAFEKRFKLYYGEAQDTYVGELVISGTRSFMYQRLWRKLFYFFATQALKTFFVSFLILLIIRKYVTNHIEQMHNYVENFDSNEYKPLILADKSESEKDEITTLVRAINHMGEVFVDSMASSKKEVEEHKTAALSSARLAGLGEMAGNIAHEINNPLMIIKSRVHKLKRIDDFDRLKGECEKLDDTIMRISDIIESMKRLLHDNGETTDLEKVDVVKIIDTACVMYKQKFHTSEIELIKDYQAGFPVVDARFSEVSQVLINLINNAYDAISDLDERWIKVKLSYTHSEVLIKIIDSGSGIPENILNKIFEPFYTTKGIGKGTGLGLSISKKIIENHGGQFSVDLSHPNTCFVIRLPIKADNKIEELAS